jgi:hypothetical protein
MNIGLRQTRILAPSLSKTIYLPFHHSYNTYGRLKLRLPTASNNHSFGAEGNLGIAPKEMSQIQNLTLNDGNGIPLVYYDRLLCCITRNLLINCSLDMAQGRLVQQIGKVEQIWIWILSTP